MVNWPLASVIVTAGVPISSTLVPALGAPSSNTDPDTVALPVMAVESVSGSRMERATNSTRRSPIVTGTSAVDDAPRRAWSVPAIELGSPQNLYAPNLSVVSRTRCGVRRMPTSLEISTSIQAMDTSALSTGCKVSGSLTWPTNADLPKRPGSAGHLSWTSVAADGTAITTTLV